MDTLMILSDKVPSQHSEIMLVAVLVVVVVLLVMIT